MTGVNNNTGLFVFFPVGSTLFSAIFTAIPRCDG